jgi:outer membrane protein TolC
LLVLSTFLILNSSDRQARLAAQGPVVANEPAKFITDVRKLTLEEARQLALQNNSSLALARTNTSVSAHATAAASKDYFPKVLGNVTYFHFQSDLGKVVTVEKGKLGLLTPGIGTFSVPVLQQDSALSTVLVAQPITKLIAVHAAVEIARADEMAAHAQLDKGTRDLLSGVTQAYHGLLGAQRIQSALELQVKMLEQLSAVKPSPEVRIGLVETRQGLLQVRGQAQELTRQLNSLLALPACTTLELVDPTPALLPVHCEQNAVDIALADNPEIHAAEQTIVKAEAALKLARMDYLPDVNVVGGFANQSIATYVQRDIGYVGLTASYTFWDWGKRRDIKRERQTQIALAHENLKVVRDKVELDVRNAYASFQQAEEANKLAREMAQARKEAEKSATGQALVQAKADTAKAELEAMKADIAYRIAHTQLAAFITK